jgi:hypothetical protein
MKSSGIMFMFVHLLPSTTHVDFINYFFFSSMLLLFNFLYIREAYFGSSFLMAFQACKNSFENVFKRNIICVKSYMFYDAIRL